MKTMLGKKNLCKSSGMTLWSGFNTAVFQKWMWQTTIDNKDVELEDFHSHETDTCFMLDAMKGSPEQCYANSGCILQCCGNSCIYFATISDCIVS